uniref:Uncharacterized protein n=1 Tax=Oryza nivara TaxID=4536 RepID=A0A0E0FUC4_ORYNI
MDVEDDDVEAAEREKRGMLHHSKEPCVHADGGGDPREGEEEEEKEEGKRITSRAPRVVPNVEVEVLPEELEAVREGSEQDVDSKKGSNAASKAATYSQLERPRVSESKAYRLDGTLKELGEDDGAVLDNGTGDAGRGHGGRETVACERARPAAARPCDLGGKR